MGLMSVVASRLAVQSATFGMLDMEQELQRASESQNTTCEASDDCPGGGGGGGGQ